MSPPAPPRRPGSSPELQGIVTPDQPERGAVRHHPGVEGAPQPPPLRRGTLPGGMSAIPQAPAVPGELAPTLPAQNPLQRMTVRRPAPPSAVTLARRSDPPVGAEPPRSQTPASGQPATPLPPPSLDPRDAQIAALRARAETAERDKAELERQQRVQVESKGPGPYQAPVERKPSPAGGTPVTDSIRPDGTLASLRKAQTRFYLALAAALAAAAIPLASWLQSAAEAKAQSARADVKANAATSAADSAKQTAGNADKELAKLREEFHQYRSNQREIWRLQGVEVPANKGDPDAYDLKPITPYCPRGKVCSGPTLVLQVAP